MKRVFINVTSGMILSMLFVSNAICSGQSGKSAIKKYLTTLPSVAVSKKTQKYVMSAIYTNRDLYGNFSGKMMIRGEYTRRFNGDSCKWNNVFVSSSDIYSGTFPEENRQSYIEDFRYVPSPKMLQPSAFSDFPPDPVSVYSRNLIWDMMAIEGFACDHFDSLKLNTIYPIPDSGNEFTMADIGSYVHAGIQLCWTGISEVKGVLCAIVEFRAIDNKIEMKMDALKTKGTEQYWGTVWVSLSDRLIEHAEMYGGTIQEIEITGMDNKFLVKTIRELWLNKIE
jgi:hypothetical protein